MARNKVTSIFLAVVLVMAIAIAPVVAIQAAQPSILAHFAQGGNNSLSIGVAGSALHGVIACEGCSAGGNGPG
jgi:hypothetical protein